jgi:DNA-binding transcriptional ArsR family regulator
MDAENIDEDRKRAEVFDALSHPARIMLLKALSEEALGFAEIKKKLGIESSGHLQHHISKLGGLIKTDDYGKYVLSDQGKDALHSVKTVEIAAGAKATENREAYTSKSNTVLKLTTVILAVLLALSLTLASFEYSNVLSLQSEISQRDSTIIDRDTLITQLDTAIRLAEAVLKLKPPSDSQYLTKIPDSNSEGETTKIFLNHTAASYSYRPPYPFNATPDVSSLNTFSSLKTFELTENRSIKLSFWGWWFNVGAEVYGGAVGGGAPALNVGVTVRNDYTSADIGAPIGNRTGSYISIVNLGIRFYSHNGSIIEVSENSDITAPTASSNVKMGGVPFYLESGQTKQVIFYLSPSLSDIEAIDHYEIYVSSLSAY